MPEGHTIHALAGRLNRAFAGRPVDVTSPQGRFAESAARVDGSLLREARAWGKHLFVEMEQEQVVHVHLGLIGNFSVSPGGPDANPVIGQVRLRIADADHTADLRGPQLCALVTPAEEAATAANLGPDPLRADADPEQGWQRLRRSRKPLAELLMDQGVVAGIGNVYRCELLHRHHLDPFTPGRDVPRETWDALWADLVRLMPLGVVFNQILTMPDQVEQAEADVADPDVLAAAADLTGRRLGDRYERRFFLYQRTGEPCRTCGTPVQSRDLAGRVLYWCPGCQTER